MNLALPQSQRDDLPETKSSSPIAHVPGTKIRYFGDYELLQEIARGGMGIVYKARQISLNRLVAVKMILSGQLASEAELKRFHTEAEAAANLDHPNIVSIYEVGEHDDQHYFSMQFVEGANLDHLVKGGQWKIGDVKHTAQLISKIARAVHYAHQHGILHRDIKPGNILVDAQGEPHITDFGLAKRLELDSSLSLSGVAMGTPGFMSPEQAAGQVRQLTTATDVYSLGAVLYHLLTGRPPFVGESHIQILRKVIEQEPPRLKSENPKIDRDLETICLKCLEKDPQRRYASADALANDLEHWQNKESITARRSTTIGHIMKWCRRKPVVALLLVALLITGFAGIMGIIYKSHQATERLWGAYLAQARASRWSNRPGRRFDGLAAISNAAAIRPSMELRNEAIACLALFDVQLQRRLQLEPDPPSWYTDLVFDHAFQRYARAHSNGDVSIHQTRDDSELMRLPGLGKRRDAALCFSPNGRFLAEKHEGKSTNFFRIWDLVQRKAVLWIPCKVNKGAIAFTPDSDTVAVSENRTLHIYDLLTAKENKTIPLSHSTTYIKFDPTGERLALCANPVDVLETQTGKTVRYIGNPANNVTCLDWSPDGRYLAISSLSHELYLWDTFTGQTNAILTGARGSIIAVTFNRGSDLLIGSSWDGFVHFWDPSTREHLQKIPAGGISQYSPFSPDDRMLCIGEAEQKPGIWNISTARECRQWQAPIAQAGSFGPQGRFLVTCAWVTKANDAVRFWDITERLLIGQLPIKGCESVIIHPDGKSLITCGASGVEKRSLSFDPDTGEIKVGPTDQLWASGLHAAALSPDGQILAATQPAGAHLLLINLTNPARPRLLQGHSEARFVSVSPDGKWVATGPFNGNTVKIWDVALGQPIKELPVDGSSTVAFSLDGQWLVTGSTKYYQIRKTDSWEVAVSIPRQTSSGLPGTIALSGDSQILAASDGPGQGMRLLSLVSGRELAVIEAELPLCFNTDNSLLAADDPPTGKMMVWDLRRIRERLASMKLDWDSPAFPPPPTNRSIAKLFLTLEEQLSPK